MMRKETVSSARTGDMRRSMIWPITVIALLVAFGCSSDNHENSSGVKYPTGISGHVEQQLKYDARVDSFESGDADLTVNVNDAWLNSPPGMQERSVGQWYALWHSNHSGSV